MKKSTKKDCKTVEISNSKSSDKTAMQDLFRDFSPLSSLRPGDRDARVAGVVVARQASRRITACRDGSDRIVAKMTSEHHNLVRRL